MSTAGGRKRQTSRSRRLNRGSPGQSGRQTDVHAFKLSTVVNGCLSATVRLRRDGDGTINILLLLSYIGWGPPWKVNLARATENSNENARYCRVRYADFAGVLRHSRAITRVFPCSDNLFAKRNRSAKSHVDNISLTFCTARRRVLTSKY